MCGMNPLGKKFEINDVNADYGSDINALHVIL